MSKVLAVEAYYSHHGGKLPVKWSPPEVGHVVYQTVDCHC